jgi:hypothetical protein
MERATAINDHPLFIAMLCDLVEEASQDAAARA